MAKMNYGISPTSVILRVKLLNSSSSTGSGLTGLTSASAGLIISTIKIGEATATAYTVTGSTIETIATLGTYATPTSTKCRFKEVDATNHKGVYELQFDNARFASTTSVIISIAGASNLAQYDSEIQTANLAADMRAINGDLTNGNNAILSLKQLDVRNTSNAAITAIGANGYAGIYATGGTGAGHGIEIQSGSGGTTAGLSIYGYGKGVDISGQSGVGLDIKGRDGAGMSISGTYAGLYVNSTTGDAILANAGGDGSGLRLNGYGTGLDLSLNTAGNQNLITPVTIDTLLTTNHGSGAWTDTGIGGLTAQETRDAMKLAPSAGAPAVGSVDLHLDNILTNVTTIDTAVNALPSLVAIKGEVDMALGIDVIGELPIAQPASTPTLKTAIMLLYMKARNRKDQTASQTIIYNNAGIPIAKAIFTNDGITVTSDKLVAGNT